MKPADMNIGRPATARGPLPITNIRVQGDTIPRMFWNAVAMRGERIAYRQKDFGIWEAATWNDLAGIVREIGMGLIELGLAVGETVSILGNTKQEWMCSDLAVLSAGAVSNGIYPTDSYDQVRYLMSDSSSVYLFLENEEQLDKALVVRADLPLLRKVIVWDMEGLRDLRDDQVMSMAQLRELGRARMERLGAQATQAEWQARIESRDAQDLAVLIYTSGTTGRPKGAMLSHWNLIFTVRALEASLPQDERDERMCFLPLCHVSERLVGCFYALYSGACLNFVENPETIPENVKEIAPTTFVAVPRTWEKFYSSVTIRVSESTALQRFAYRCAIAVGERIVHLREKDQPIGVGLRLQHWLARVLVLNNVRKLIGVHRCRYLISGSAPIAPDLLRWYMALGLTVLEGWGQTECGATGTMMPLSRTKPGSVGVANPHMEMRVSEQGELMIRGDNVFMGYLNQPEKTAETVDAEGWLHTGDVATVDADGFYRITDRIKDIIITAGGKNITPSEFENQLKFSPYITDAVLIGDKRPYLTALVMIDHENVEKFAQDHDIPFSNYTSLCRSPEILALIESELERVNKLFARVEQVKKFRLIEQKLSAEDEEVTPTMKLKRNFVSRKYADLIASMY